MSDTYNPDNRMAQPGEDDFKIERIEVEFAIPVWMTQQQQEALADLIQAIATTPMNIPVNGVHWHSDTGSKPHWNAVDAALLGKRATPGAPIGQEPTFDDSVLYLGTSARETFGEERKNYPDFEA